MDEDMDDIKEYLEDLIGSITGMTENVLCKGLNLAAYLQKTPHASHIAVRIIANKIHSSKELEAMQALSLLDLCMKECGAAFQAEVGKFRFLNELIKIVSAKYLGNRTSPLVRQKVLELLYGWTQEYPHETKIQEAFEMLKKQGVVPKDEPIYISSQCEEQVARARSLFEDDERSRVLQKLLQSKNPDDLQAANRLIKTMVREDERRAERITRRNNELESVRNNAKLLSEMLNTYDPGSTSTEELEVIKEVHQSCERLRPVIIRLASETQDDEKILGEVLSASDLLASALDKYSAIIQRGLESTPSKTGSLLDLSTPNEERLPLTPSSAWLHDQLQDTDVDKKQSSPADSAQQSSLEVLGDPFGPLAPNELSAAASATTTASPVVHAEPAILQPVSLLHSTGKKGAVALPPEAERKPKGLAELDLLGEIMLKESLPAALTPQTTFSRSFPKIPMSKLCRGADTSSASSGDSGGSADTRGAPKVVFKLRSGTADNSWGSSGESGGSDVKLLEDRLQSLDLSDASSSKSIMQLERPRSPVYEQKPFDLEREMCGGDDATVSGDTLPDISETSIPESLPLGESDNSVILSEGGISQTAIEALGDVVKHASDSSGKQVDIKSLSEVSISLDSIKPGTIPPKSILEENAGLSVTLHFAEDSPRPDVSVIVVTTMNRSKSPINSFLFQAVVPKTCKIRLLPPSGTDLPAHNPFLPPPAISQVMLIANPLKVPVNLKFVVSYTLDGETVTEMGEIEELPLSA